jgi:hypothetical protein
MCKCIKNQLSVIIIYVQHPSKYFYECKRSREIKFSNHFSANVGRPAVMKNAYLENRRQAQLNKARGQGYAGVS